MSITRRALSVVVALALVLSCLPPVVHAGAVGSWGDEPITEWYTGLLKHGTGTAADPFVIDTADELAGLAKLTNEGHDFRGEYIRLGADLDLSGKNWVPIGTNDRPFNGSFDGSGHIIKNLTIDAPSQAICGLFGMAGTSFGSVTIKDLGLVNVNISGLASAGGGLVGCLAVDWDFVTAAIEGCFVTGSIQSGAASGILGGLVGDVIVGSYGWTTSLTISNCYAACDIALTSTNEDPYTRYAGGLIGQLQRFLLDVSISNSYSVSRVTTANTERSRVGAFAGLVNTTTGITMTACLFDLQAAGLGSGFGTGSASFDGVGSVEGKLTAQMTGADALPTGWESAWQAAAGRYPQLTAFAGSDPYGVSALPVFLDVDDTSVLVRSGFTVPDVTNVTWSSSPPGILSVNSSTGGVTIQNPDSDTVVTLTATDTNPDPDLGVSKDFALLVIHMTSTATDIKSFRFGLANETDAIDAVNHTIAVTVPYGTNLANLAAIFTLSHGATANVGDTRQETGVTPNSFASQVTYTVTAEDGTTQQNWTVSVTIALNAATEIASFGFGLGENRSINSVSHLVAVTVPYGTNVTNLKATFSLSDGATASVGGTDQVSGDTTNNFEENVTYRITAQNGTTQQDWTVSVTVGRNTATEIITFGFGGLGKETDEIYGGGRLVAVTVPYGTDVTGLKANFTLSDGATASVGGTNQVSGNTTNDFTDEVTYKITAGDGTTSQDWRVSVMAAQNTAADITAFGFGLTGETHVINAVDHKVAVTVPYGTDVTCLKATFSLSYGAKAWVGVVEQETGNSTNNFSANVIYAVNPEDWSRYEYWIVSVTVAPNTANDITAFGFGLTGEIDNINSTNHTVAVTVPYGTNVTNLAATFTLSPEATAKIGDTVQVTEETTNDFTNPVTYTITAENGSAQNWMVTCVPNVQVTFDKNGGGIEANPNTVECTPGNSLGNLPSAPTRAGYNFASWNTKADGTDTEFTAMTPVTADITVYAQWTMQPHDDGGSSSGDNGQPEGPTTKTTTEGNVTTGTTTTTASTDSTGTASASVTQSQVSDAITKAVAEAGKQGHGAEARVEIEVDAPAGARTVEITIPQASVDRAAEGGITSLTVSTPVASITFDSAALSTISGEASGDVKIAVARVDVATLPEEARQVVGDRPVFNFSVTSGSKTISEFGGNVEVSVPYTPKPGEDPNAIVIYYVNAEGGLEVVSNCAYDPATGTVRFTTDHFSRYAVGYNKVAFNDVPEDAWYNNAVGFIAARGITTGTGGGNYSPEAKLTRAQLLVMVMRAYGISPDENPSDNFADAGNTYYTGYLAAAKRLGLSSGVGGNLYAPDRDITRQEMFTLLYNTLKLIRRLPAGAGGKALSDFSDAAWVALWAKDAMTLFAGTGVVQGSAGMLNPEDVTTRAEMAQLLYNLLAK